MNVQGLGHPASAGLKTPPFSKTRDSAAGKPVFKITDTYEPSQESPERKELLQDIRKKISNGYYNSEKVADDISYGFANILNQM